MHLIGFLRQCQLRTIKFHSKCHTWRFLSDVFDDVRWHCNGAHDEWHTIRDRHFDLIRGFSMQLNVHFLCARCAQDSNQRFRLCFICWMQMQWQHTVHCLCLPLHVVRGYDCWTSHRNCALFIDAAHGSTAHTITICTVGSCNYCIHIIIRKLHQPIWRWLFLSSLDLCEM